MTGDRWTAERIHDELLTVLEMATDKAPDGWPLAGLQVEGADTGGVVLEAPDGSAWTIAAKLLRPAPEEAP